MFLCFAGHLVRRQDQTCRENCPHCRRIATRDRRRLDEAFAVPPARQLWDDGAGDVVQDEAPT